MIHYSDLVSVKIANKKIQKWYYERTNQFFKIGTTICVDRALAPDLIYRERNLRR